MKKSESLPSLIKRGKTVKNIPKIRISSRANRSFFASDSLESRAKHSHRKGKGVQFQRAELEPNFHFLLLRQPAPIGYSRLWSVAVGSGTQNLAKFTLIVEK